MRYGMNVHFLIDNYTQKIEIISSVNLIWNTIVRVIISKSFNIAEFVIILQDKDKIKYFL